MQNSSYNPHEVSVTKNASPSGNLATDYFRLKSPVPLKIFPVPSTAHYLAQRRPILVQKHERSPAQKTPRKTQASAGQQARPPYWPPTGPGL